jgi:hypothetical protein
LGINNNDEPKFDIAEALMLSRPEEIVSKIDKNLVERRKELRNLNRTEEHK